MDKQEALSICFANLKGTKNKDLLGTARALQFLKSLPEYRSNEKVGQAVGVSGEVVREFLTLLRLPGEIQSLFEQRQLKTLEHGRRLWQLARVRPDLLGETANAVSDVSAFDGRHIVDYILKNPDVPVAEARRRVLESKTIIERQFHVIAVLSEEDYHLIADAAGRRGLTVSALVTSIVQDWVESEERGRRS